MVQDEMNTMDGERAAVYFLRKKFDIFEPCESLHCQHEQRAFTRCQLTGFESVLQGYHHDSIRRYRCAP
jgi:hypothetical protein